MPMAESGLVIGRGSCAREPLSRLSYCIIRFRIGSSCELLRCNVRQAGVQRAGRVASAGERCGDTAGAGRRSGRIPPPHESETASATNRSAVESPRLHLASAGVGGRAKTAIAPSRRRHSLPGNEPPQATSHREIANNR